MHPSTLPTLRAALHMLYAELSEHDRVLGARTWLRMYPGDKPSPEERSRILELRDLMD